MVLIMQDLYVYGVKCQNAERQGCMFLPKMTCSVVKGKQRAKFVSLLFSHVYGVFFSYLLEILTY